MIAIIATAIACFIVGGVLSYILFRYVLKSKYDNVLKEAETEAEVIKKNKLLEVKEKFLNKKADLEKEVALRNQKIQQAENKLKQREMVLSQRQEILALRTGGNLLFCHGQLSIEINECLLALILLHTDHYHIAGAVAGDINGLTSLAAEVRDIIGIAAKIGNWTNTWHTMHPLVFNHSIAK